MSRIGKKAIIIPKDVSVILNEGQIVVKGKYGTLSHNISQNINVLLENEKVVISRKNDEKNPENLMD